MKLIDVDALMQALGITNMDCDKCAWCDMEWGHCKRGGDFEDACCAIETAPIIEERKTGKWIAVDDADGLIAGKCSACGWEAYLYETDVVGMGYCPNCGARKKEVP